MSITSVRARAAHMPGALKRGLVSPGLSNKRFAPHHARETQSAARRVCRGPSRHPEFPAHERTQHRTSKGLGECGDIVQGNRTNVPSARNPPSVMVKSGFTANQKNR